jgi:hypothetical protein
MTGRIDTHRVSQLVWDTPNGVRRCVVHEESKELSDL